MPPNYEIDTKATTLCSLETFMQTNKRDKASKGPVLAFFENCRSNNTCVLKIKDELRISLFKYYQAIKEKIGLVEISYRDNDYVTAASSTKLKGYGQFLPLLMNLNNSVTIKLGCLNQINLSTLESITNGLRGFYTEDKGTYMADKDYCDYVSFLQYWNQTAGKEVYLDKKK